MWQQQQQQLQNVINDHTKTAKVVPITTYDYRLIHTIIWFLLPEDYLRHIIAVLVFLVLVCIKIVPLPIWMTIFFRLCFGTTASIFYLGFQIGLFVTKAIFKRLKKRNVPDVMRVR
jgi:hypothetical protein